MASHASSENSDLTPTTGQGWKEQALAALSAEAAQVETSEQNDHGERQTESPSLLKRLSTIATNIRSSISHALGMDKPKARRRARSLYGVESLEARTLMSATPAEISWAEGRNDAAHILGQANILPGSNLYDIESSPTGDKLIVSGQFNKSNIVDAKTGQTLVALSGHSSSVISAVWSPDGTSLFTASYDKHVRQYSSSGTLLWDSGDIGTLAVGVDLSPDGTSLFVRRHEQNPLAINVATKTITTLTSAGTATDLDALENNALLVTKDHEVRIVDAATNTSVWTVGMSGKNLTNSAATSDGSHVFVGTDNGTIMMIRRDTGASVTIASAGSYVRDMTMDETGTMLVVGTNNDLRVYDVDPLLTGGASIAAPTVFPFGSSSVTVSGGVAFVNNVFDGASSRSIAVDLSSVPELLTRLGAGQQNNQQEEQPEENIPETLPSQITFAGLTVGNLDASLTSSGATINLPVIGNVKVFSGGFTPMRVTQTGGLETGVNGGHMTLHFETPTYVDSLTVRQGGTGVRKYNLGNGYQDMIGLTEIPVDKVLSDLSFIVYDSAEVEIESINIPPAVAPVTTTQEIVVDSPQEVAISLVTQRSGNTETRSANWNDLLTAPAQDAYFSNLQVMSQWWAPGGEYIGIRSTLAFQAPTVADGLRIASARLVFTGTNKLNTTNSPLSLHAVLEGSGSAGSISYENFALGENTMELNPALLFGQDGIIKIDLRTSMDALNQAPSKSGNNAYSFYLGNVADGDTAPKLLLTYETIPAGEEAPLSPEVLSQPALSSVAFEGSTAMVRIRPDLASGTVGFEGEQEVNRYLSTQAFTKTEGIPTLATISLDGKNPSGEYSIVIRNQEGIEISRMSVQWNRDTKTLSLPDGITSYVATDAEQASINDAKEIMRLSLLDLGVSTKNFAVTQQAILLSSMKEILGIQDLQVAFDAAHPEWNDGVMYAKAQADSQTTNFSFDQIYTSLVHQKSDTLGILRQDYGAYEWMLGDFMKQAMTVLAKMRAGMSQREAITPLEDAMYRQSYSLPMYRLASIGIHFPSTDALLRATAAVSDAVMHDMLRIQEDERQAILRDQAASNNPDYAGTGISEELLAQYAAEEKAAHLHNLVVISQSEGDGDPLARAWAYGTNNGLTEVEMREALGLTQEQVDLILGKITDLTDDGSDKIVTPEGDILTRMSRDSLTRIRDNATRALASAIARDDAENTAFFTLQLEAADGLLALIPTGENTPVIGENATALGWKELIERTTSDPTGEGSKLFIGGLQLDLKTLQHMEIDHDTDLGRFAGAKLIDFPTHMSAGVSKTYTFQLTETAMVNLWTRGAGLHDLNLRISGGGIGFGYPSQKSGMNGGESISLKLTPGTYTFTIEDKTQYGSLYMGSYVGTADYKVTTGIDITPFNSANIEGKISIDGSPKVMPVSMRVAEFDTSGQRKTNYDITEGNDAITRLNPSLPVWVVIHGRKDSERGNSINELTQRLVESSNGRYQVVTVNWEDAAKDIAMPFGIDIGDLEDAKWTPAVGKWIGQQLLAAGFKAADIRFAAHSHGTFGAYFAAEWIKEKTGGQLVGTIIAMDSAKNPVFFGAGIPEERIQFKNVSQNSIGIHSSFLGSANRAFGAHRSIGVSSPDTISPLTEHGYAVTLFSDALDDINHGINMNIATIFALNDRGNIPVGFIPDKEGYDAWISVRSSKKVTETGDWWRAQASALWYKKPDGTWENPLFDPEIINSSDSLPEFPSSGEGTLIN